MSGKTGAELEMKRVSFGFPGGEPLFTELDFRLEKGGFMALIGPNGAGKTTLLHLLSGHLRPSAGQVLLRGEPVAGYPPRVRAALLAAVPQNVFSPLPFTVEQVVALGCLSRQGRFSALSADDRQAVAAAMEAMDVAKLRGREFTRLSGGERQRALVAAALAQRSRIIMLDEPTSHLDIGHAVRLMEALATLNAETGVTLLVISHDVQTMARYCPTLAIMHGGGIAAQGNTAEIMNQPLLSHAYGTALGVAADPVRGRPLVFPR